MLSDFIDREIKKIQVRATTTKNVDMKQIIIIALFFFNERDITEAVKILVIKFVCFIK